MDVGSFLSSLFRPQMAGMTPGQQEAQTGYRPGFSPGGMGALSGAAFGAGAGLGPLGMLGGGLMGMLLPMLMNRNPNPLLNQQAPLNPSMTGPAAPPAPILNVGQLAQQMPHLQQMTGGLQSGPGGIGGAGSSPYNLFGRFASH